MQRESREWSVFNFGSSSAAVEAISRGISLYNGQAVPVSDLLQRESREWSVFNFGSPSATYEAISREVSVLNFTEPKPFLILESISSHETQNHIHPPSCLLGRHPRRPRAAHHPQRRL
ncbi:MAG: hypothetical protein IPK32_14520 [Verrucomicrobiaceae bacterium]|nr:hypothetical protein [Verrucomicrobiaceae bacterium]